LPPIVLAPTKKGEKETGPEAMSKGEGLSAGLPLAKREGKKKKKTKEKGR